MQEKEFVEFLLTSLDRLRVQERMQDIIVFGHGRYYQKKKESIEKEFCIVAFLDNAVDMNEVQYDNETPVYNPCRIKELPQIPIALMSSKYYEMTKQLSELGEYKNRRIVFGANLEPAVDPFEDLLRNMNCELVVSGEFLGLRKDEEIHSFKDEEELKDYIRALERETDSFIQTLSDMPIDPVSRRFGLERGNSIARYYIDGFIDANKSCIVGNVMEIADRRYSGKYCDNIRKSMCLHVNGWGENVIKGNLETGEGIEEGILDCFICTQTLLFTFDLRSVVKNIHRLLKNGGKALITVPGITHLSLYDYDNWGQYWCFTDMSLRKLFETVFEKDKIEIETFGNMKTAIGYLYGLTVEDMTSSDLGYNDKQYQLIITAKVVK